MAMIESGYQTVVCTTVFSGQLLAPTKISENKNSTKCHDPGIK
jgi:hypothetical protein